MFSFKPLASLTYRNFRLFWIGSVISLTGTWMHSAAQGWLVFELTNSPFYLGLTSTASSLPILLFTMLGGVVADRMSKKTIIMTTQIVLMCIALLMATIVSADVVKVWHVLIIAFLIGSAHAFEIPARQSFFIEMVGRENLLNAIALNSAAFHGARMAGPAIAGLIMGTWSIAACFYINTLSFIAAIVALIKMRFRPEDEKKRPQKKGLYKEFAEGMKYIFSNQKVFTLIISVGIISFFGFPYITFLPVYAKEILKTGATGLGILMGCAGAGAFTGAIILAFRGDFSKKGLLLIVSGIVFSLALLVFSISATIWLSYVMLFLIGLGAINQIATANTLLQLNVPDELRGRIMSSFTTVFLGMSTIGNFIVGSYAALVGTKTALLTSSIFCLLGTLLLVMKKPEILEIGSH